MTSLAQIRANCRNARRSPGPKSVVGKQRVARNACRHGLTGRLPPDSSDAEQAQAMVNALLAGQDDQPEIRQCARDYAEAQVKLRLINQHRLEVVRSLGGQLSHRANSPESPLADLLHSEQAGASILARLRRYDRLVRGQRQSAIERLKALGFNFIDDDRFAVTRHS